MEQVHFGWGSQSTTPAANRLCNILTSIVLRPPLLQKEGKLFPIFAFRLLLFAWRLCLWRGQGDIQTITVILLCSESAEARVNSEEKTKPYHFNPAASNPHAADISNPLDFRIEAEIPETTRLCLKYSILSGVEEVNESFPVVWNGSRFTLIPESLRSSLSSERCLSVSFRSWIIT